MGMMGKAHAERLLSGKIPGGELKAVMSSHPEKIKEWAELNNVHVCEKTEDVFLYVDALIIATPHPLHPQIGIQAFQAGKHVLVEKPVGVETQSVKLLNQCARESGKAFGVVYNLRMDPLYIKIRDLINNNELGEIHRVTWKITDWYRSQAYYDNGKWRGTWEGEGGGVLMNQAVHNLDILQWIFGMPKMIQAFMQYGKGHNIEVEDEVTAYMEFDNKMTGVFIAATHETPGTNRMEIAGDRGKLVVENGEITFYRNRIGQKTFNKINKNPFGRPEMWICKIPVEKQENDGVTEILKEFTATVEKNTPLTAPGEDGIKGLMIANMMYLSAYEKRAIYLENWDDKIYQNLLQKRINESRIKKQE